MKEGADKPEFILLLSFLILSIQTNCTNVNKIDIQMNSV